MEEVEVAINPNDLLYAIESIYMADQEFCISTDNCSCNEIASRLSEVLERAGFRR